MRRIWRTFAKGASPSLNKEETVASLGEFGCIDAVCRDLIYRPELVRIGAGDDGAVYVSPPGTEQVISTDTMVEGIHFTEETMGPADVGWKLCTANFSDMAAMGAEPAQMVISAALPKNLPLSWLTACYDGIRKACRTFRVNLLGGDMTGSRQGVVLTGTVVGHVPAGQAVLRSGARPGDVLALAGTVGGSAAGLAALLAGRGAEFPACTACHQRPRPQIEAGRILREAGARALDDITDGLASEANEVAQASGMDLLIDAARVPISEETERAAAALGADALHWALTGGEDYALLAAGPAEAIARAAERTPLAVIGRVTGPGGAVYLARDGKTSRIGRAGYDHFKQPLP